MFSSKENKTYRNNPLFLQFQEMVVPGGLKKLSDEKTLQEQVKLFDALNLPISEWQQPENIELYIHYRKAQGLFSLDDYPEDLKSTITKALDFIASMRLDDPDNRIGVIYDASFFRMIKNRKIYSQCSLGFNFHEGVLHTFVVSKAHAFQVPLQSDQFLRYTGWQEMSVLFKYDNSLGLGDSPLISVNINLPFFQLESFGEPERPGWAN